MEGVVKGDKTVQVQPQKLRLGEYFSLCGNFEIMDYAFPVLNKQQTVRAYEGFKVRSMHGPFVDINFASNDKEIRRLSQRKIEKAVAYGVELGAENVVLHSAFFPNLSSEGLKDIWCDLAAEYLEKLVAKFPVCVFVENTLDFFPDVLALLTEKTKNERINVCLDVGHAALSRAPLDDWFAALAPRIKYMHVNDNNGVYDDHLVMGEGTIDWANVKRLMIKYRTEPIVTVELSGLENVKKGLEFWSALWQK